MSPGSVVQKGGADVTLRELTDWGTSFGRSLKPPCVVALSGDLGAGKTTLAQAICRGVGIRTDVTSPTFSLVNSYEVNGITVYHLDLYRLRNERDLTNLGWHEIVHGDHIVLVEWPERAGAELPADAIHVALEHVDGRDDLRRLKAP